MLTKSLLQALKGHGAGVLPVQGPDDHALPLLVAEMADNLSAPVVVVARDHAQLSQFVDEISFLRPKRRVLAFPAWDVQPYDRLSADAEVQSARLEALSALKGTEPVLVVTTAAALTTKTPPATSVAPGFTLAKGTTLLREQLVQTLEHCGYRRVGTVMEPGEYAIRGAVVDIYLATDTAPCRAEFFDDEVESLRRFDPVTQRTTGQVASLVLQAATEVRLDETSVTNFRRQYRAHFPEGGEDEIYRDISERRSHPSMGHYLPLFHDVPLGSFFDVVPAGTLFVASTTLGQAVASAQDLIRDAYQSRLNPPKTNLDGERTQMYRPLPPESLYLTIADWDAVKERHRWLSLRPLKDNNPAVMSLRVHSHIPYPARRQPGVNPVDVAVADIKSAAARGNRVVLSVLSRSGLERTLHLLADHGLEGLAVADDWADAVKAKTPTVLLSPLTWGVHDEEAGLFLLTEQDLFGEKQNPRPVRRRRSADEVISHFSEVAPGDLVVHIDHGIGRFKGLETITFGPTTQDFLVLEYDGGDKLMVPVVALDVLSRYAGGEVPHALDRLGSAAWQARKASVKKRLLDMAADLLKVAAARQMRHRPRYKRPDGLYDEFVGNFPYMPTAEQQRAIDDVEADFATDTPMDRLVVGDVGFGKTEVALRAAFLAAADGRQVAMIAPTTLLARQHAQVFRQRFAGFPFQIGHLSRLASAGEVKRTKAGLKDGGVDIVVGTHALLAKGIDFKNLGLVIVDEEQRFGVAHKERLKQLRHDVDVLTLTATPIPRTLQMSLSGMRSLSTITTPPVDRLAVRSYVMGFDGKVLREAILREMFRNGQVYVVTPRIEGIETLAKNLQDLVPEAKVRLAHGQMGKDELEQVMEDFYDGKFNVLVATAIIESGLDIPTANTMIIHRADRFGLAQLYQLRGRVGRSKARAYAYFLIPDGGHMTDDAEKRLKILQRLEGIGAGFTLASYDMDLRGPGNLLGAEQSGHIREVGFELYNQMLREAIESLRAERAGTAPDDTPPEGFVPTLNLGVSFLIPESYAPDLNLRLSLYRRLSRLTEAAEVDTFRDELLDRFGHVAPEVAALLDVVHLRNQCRRLNIEKIEVGEKGAVISFYKDRFAKPQQLLHYILENAGVVTLRPDQKIVLHRRWPDPVARLAGIRSFLDTLEKLNEQKEETARSA